MAKERIYSKDELPCYLSAKDISAFLGLGLTKTYDLINNTDCPKFRYDDRIMVPRDKFLCWLDEHTEGFDIPQSRR